MNNINNIRSSNTNPRGGNPMSYQKHTGNNNFAPPAPNSGAFVLAATHNPRHFLNNQGDMKSNHMANMAHGQIQLVPNPANIPHRQQALSHHIRQNAPRNLPRGHFQYQVYMPGSHIQAYQGNGNHAYYPYSPQTSQGAVIVPFIQNYPSNQPNIYYNTTPSRPMVNLQQGLQNTSVTNMNATLSTAQNSHGPSLIVQSQPMEIASNTQPLQVQQQQPSTPMQPQEPRPQKRTKNIIKITHPDTGAEIDLRENTPSFTELEKMKVQSQFQSQVQSVVKKDDSKVSDDNQNNEGGENIRNEFASQVKKLASKPNNSDLEDDDVPTKSIEEVEAQSPEEVSVTEESHFIAPIVDDVSVENIDTTSSTIDLPTNTEEVLDIPKNETKTNPLPSSTPTRELPPPSTDIAIVPEESNTIKKNPDEQSVKPDKTSLSTALRSESVFR